MKAQVTESEALVKRIDLVAAPTREWLAVKGIEDNEHFVQADAALREVKALIAKAEAQRKEITKPLNDVIKTVNSKVKPLTNRLEQIESHIKRLLMLYEAERRAKAAKAAEKEAKHAEKLGAEDLANDIRQKALTITVVPSTGLQFRDNWKPVIADGKAFLTWCIEERLEYVEFSPGKALLALKETRPEIPGIKWRNERFTVAGR